MQLEPLEAQQHQMLGAVVSLASWRVRVELSGRLLRDMAVSYPQQVAVLLGYEPEPSAWLLVALLTTVPVAAKFALVAALARAFRTAPGVALRTGLYLAQAGEFGFVLLSLAQERHLVPPDLLHPILASMVLSMLATPLIIQASNRIVMKLVASDWMIQSLQMTSIARRP